MFSLPLTNKKIKRVNQKHRVILVMKYHILGFRPYMVDIDNLDDAFLFHFVESKNTIHNPDYYYLIMGDKDD